jgi:hypothetical protein
MRHAMNNVSPLVLLAALLAGVGASAWAQPLSCSSDGVPRPVALLERFISADCDVCWRDAATPKPGRGELALDWIAPGQRGDDAPLSAAALRDALARMKELGVAAPGTATNLRLPAHSNGHNLRVARGPSFNGYMGASIELKPGSGGPWHAWLLLVEALPAGAAGSPVPRNLVRNVFQPDWGNPGPLSKREQMRLFESRPMSIPPNANPLRLQVVGWVQDAQGRIQAIARSRCAPAAGKG